MPRTNQFCVLPQFRRHGVGRSLLKNLEQECRNRRQIAIELNCPEDLPANLFYGAVGFKRGPLKKGRKRNLVVWHWPVNANRLLEIRNGNGS